jgi:DnaA family protein
VQQLPLGVRIRDRAVFGTYLPARNTQAVDHLALVADGHRFETTWICGPHGTGKTHLLQAVCVRASEGTQAGEGVRTGEGAQIAASAGAQAGAGAGAPGGQDADVSAGWHAGQLVQAAYYPMREFSSLGVGVLDELPPFDCLCLDDVDAITGKRDWERALFRVLRDMQERGARLVMSAGLPPALIQWSLPDLGSRCAASAVFQLRALDEEEQREALKLRARVRGFELPDDTARWLQRRFPRDMRTLYDLLDTLDEASLIAQRRLTVPFIRSVLKDNEPTG